MTGALVVDQDPLSVGVDPTRLARLDSVLSRYVDDGRLPGWQVLVTRRGQLVHSSVYGHRDVEASLPVQLDTLWRIYSMTKPVTAVAAMTMFEEGAFSLNDEVARYLPAFRDMRILRGGTPAAPKTVPATEPMRMWHLFSHTAGLTYGFTRSSLLDEIYRAADSDFAQPRGMDLAQLCDLWASLPLLFEPGSAWNYSVASDVLGRVLEVLSGTPLDEVFTQRVLAPLGMTDTCWWVDGARADRLAALYVPDPVTGKAIRHDAMSRAALSPPDFLGGGGGLISSAADYSRFTAMLAGGGRVGDVRILAPRTLAFMTANHLPGGQSLAALARGQFAEVGYDGLGYGLGFGVLLDPVAAKLPGTVGEFTWGGAASTAFFVDPAEELTAHFYTQLLPSSTYPVRTQLRQLIYSALLDDPA